MLNQDFFLSPEDEPLDEFLVGSLGLFENVGEGPGGGGWLDA